MRTGLLRRVQPGAFAFAGAAQTYEFICAAGALAAANPLGALSHRPAGRKWGLRTVDTEIDVVIRYPRKLSLKGVNVHRSRDLEPADITWVDGIPVTTPARTICDFGLIFPDHEVERVMDHAVATGLVTRAELDRIRLRISSQGRNGAGRVRRGLAFMPDLAAATESGIEVAFLRLCERAGLPIPVCQHPVVVGSRSFRLDFAYPDQRIFVEMDGVASHGSDNAQIANDGFRQNLLVTAGWTPIRLMSRDLRSKPSIVVVTIRQVLADSGLR